jgi:transcriptional regulator with XRE-family HTH domain
MTSLNKTVGRMIATLRSRAGLSAPQVAHALGWPPATLANFEVGRRPLTVERLAAIAAVLGRHPAALLVEDTERADLVNTLLTDEAAYQQIRYLLAALDELSPPPEP